MAPKRGKATAATKAEEEDTPAPAARATRGKKETKPEPVVKYTNSYNVRAVEKEVPKKSAKAKKEEKIEAKTAAVTYTKTTFIELLKIKLMRNQKPIKEVREEKLQQKRRQRPKKILSLPLRKKRNQTLNLLKKKPNLKNLFK
jgi:hypothetical protein